MLVTHCSKYIPTSIDLAMRDLARQAYRPNVIAALLALFLLNATILPLVCLLLI